MRRITLAVSFDDRLEDHLTTGVALASLLHATLRLVHVAEPWTASALARSAAKATEAGNAALRRATHHLAQARLEELARSLPTGLSCETAVLDGEIVPALTDDTRSHPCELLLAGCDARMLGSGTGCSTAVGLALDSNVPLLALDSGVRFAPREPGLTVLLADDLGAGSRRAVGVAAGLAAATPGGRLVHLHAVAPDDLDRLDAAVTETRSRLEDRIAPHLARLEETACAYYREVVVGGVAQALEEAAAAARADLVVCGAHLLYHRDARRPGQLPFRTMMGRRRPVVVVPQ